MRRGRNIAEFDKRVQVLKRTRTRDARTGELVETWSKLGGEIWAAMHDGKSLERYVSQQKVAEVSHGWRFSYAAALLALTPDEHRLRYNAQEFDIHGVLEIQRRQGVMVLAMARGEGLTALDVPSNNPGD